MAIREYSSEDAGAPVITGEAGTLVNLLDKILVQGYGARGELGWTKLFSASNKAAYQMPAGTNMHILRVDDDGVTSGRQAAVRGYETMSDIDTGSGPFPTLAQQSNFHWDKSSAASADQRAWHAVGDDANGFFMLAIDFYGDGREVIWGFGQGRALNSADAWLTVLSGTNSAGASAHSDWSVNRTFSATSQFLYAARSYSGSPGAVALGWHVADDGRFGSNANVAGEVSLSITGGQILMPADLLESLGGDHYVRGSLPGFWQGMYLSDEISGTLRNDFEELPGRSLRAIKSYRDGSNHTWCYLDETGPW